MKLVSFKEYEDAKLEIIFGVEYKEETLSPNQYGMFSKQYHTIKNGTFYEVTNPNTGITEFWSDKHSESRYYDGRTRKEAMPHNFLIQLIIIIKDMKTTGNASLHALDPQTIEKMNLLLDEMIEAAELTHREFKKEAV